MVGSLVRATRVTTRFVRPCAFGLPSPPLLSGGIRDVVHARTIIPPRSTNRTVHPIPRERGIERGIFRFFCNNLSNGSDFLLPRPRGFTTISPTQRTHDPIVVYFLLLRVTATAITWNMKRVVLSLSAIVLYHGTLRSLARPTISNLFPFSSSSSSYKSNE